MQEFVRLAVSRPISIVVFALSMTILGFISWRELPIDLLPDVESPTILVSVSSAERPAEQMERLFGERIEQLLFTVDGLRSIEQVARNGSLISRVTFDWDSDMDLALVNVNRALSSISAHPDVDQLRVMNFDIRQSPIAMYGLYPKYDNIELAELRRMAMRQLAPKIEQLEGVAEARVTGGRVKEVQVRIDNNRLLAYGISLNEVSQRLNAENNDFNVGTIEEARNKLLVRSQSRFMNPKDVEQVVVRYIPRENGAATAVKISDIAEVTVADGDLEHLVRVNGREGVGFFVYKESGKNTVAVSQKVAEAIAQIAVNLPELEMVEVSNSASLIEDAIENVEMAALAGIVLVVLILIAFLRSPGPILIVALAVPVSLLVTVFFMDLGGYSLNLITLGGLALGIGMLVDNSIVVIESIFRRRAMGDGPVDAAINGTVKVGGAIVASTLTTCAVFLPVIFIEGMASRLVSGIAFTVACSLFVSLLVSIFLIPALSVGVLPKQDPSKEGRHFDPGHKKVETWVQGLLAHSGKVIFTGLLMVVAATYFLTRLGTELLPPSDPRQFSVLVNTQPGQRVESTAVNVANVEAIINEIAQDKVVAILSDVGKIDDDRTITERGTNENSAVVHVRLSADGLSNTNLTASRIVKEAGAEIKKLHSTELSWNNENSLLGNAAGSAEAPIVVELLGESLGDLRQGTDMIQNELRQLNQLWNVETSFEDAPMEMRITLNRMIADGLSVNADILRPVLEASLDGLKATTMYIGDESRDIVLNLPPVSREQILSLPIQTDEGKILTLGDVAEVSFESGAREIFRKNQRRIARVTASISQGIDSPDARAAVTSALQSTELPQGVVARLGGEESERKATINELGWAAALALLLVFMVLAGSFESLLLPFVVLATIPLALVGVAFTLTFQASPIGIMAMLGLIVLTGVAVNNAILLAQTAQSMIKSGTETSIALSKAAAQRLRPITMTTATTIFSLLPLALGPGEAAELRSPLAWTVVGGIIASTLACLFVIPCIYFNLDNLRKRWTS